MLTALIVCASLAFIFMVAYVTTVLDNKFTDIQRMINEEINSQQNDIDRIWRELHKKDKI